ncbi:hypothetical protein C7N43_05215 [Sphingobacteriales bacterium UPWRP_1]|nr:hypothetical protein BVG80_09705 [Sphingobacteriales bacterium TSM_CSM]PSJ78102.1 hypothetical protein C7N43_05215 [Sphingobacteriales bacterium UPWRP_1]
MDFTFHNSGHRQQFEQKGYLVVNLLTAAEVAELLQFYHSLHHSHKTGYGFHVSLDNTDPEFVCNINNRITAVLQRSMEQLFGNFRLFSGRFLVKDHNRLGLVTPHQDWSFTDETRSVSATVWVPLQDTTIQNGAIGVIEGSHLAYTGIRATPLPVFKVPFDDCSPQIFPYLKIIDMQAGQALLMNNRLIHGSPPNLGSNARISAGAEIIPQSAPLYHYYLHPTENMVMQYAIDDTFFYHYSNAKLLQLYQKQETPQGLKLIGKLPYNHAQQTWETVSQIIQSGYVHPFGPLMQQIYNYSYHLSDTPPFASNVPQTTPNLKSQQKSVWNWVKSKLQP